MSFAPKSRPLMNKFIAWPTDVCRNEVAEYVLLLEKHLRDVIRTSEDEELVFGKVYADTAQIRRDMGYPAWDKTSNGFLPLED